MKILAVEKDSLSLDVLFDMASEGTVVITRDNKPVFALVAVDEKDLQTWQLGQNQDFLALMRRSWDRLHAEGGVSLAEARQRLLAENC
jgi:antitoxin (DNA-binding transcriptional repressor) of toxin-antitoxin stability system